MALVVEIFKNKNNRLSSANRQLRVNQKRQRSLMAAALKKFSSHGVTEKTELKIVPTKES